MQTQVGVPEGRVQGSPQDTEESLPWNEKNIREGPGHPACTSRCPYLCLLRAGRPLTSEGDPS